MTTTKPITDPHVMYFNNSNNDLHAFEQLFHQHYNDMCRYAYKIVDCEEIAKEIVNDVFLKIWQNRDSVNIKTCINAYLIKATRNKCIDYLRKKVRAQCYCEEILEATPSHYAHADDILIGQETHSILNEAIEKLPKQCKLVFSMSRDKGMSYTEIADTLGLGIKTVETHIGRALKILRDIIKQKALLLFYLISDLFEIVEYSFLCV